jgi:hypothetical protein
VGTGVRGGANASTRREQCAEECLVGLWLNIDPRDRDPQLTRSDATDRCAESHCQVVVILAT